jgi:hypothetical protein
MRDTEKRQDDEDPGPLKHSDAERLTSGGGDTSDSGQDIEDDPSRNPPERELGDVKGG